MLFLSLRLHLSPSLFPISPRHLLFARGDDVKGVLALKKCLLYRSCASIVRKKGQRNRCHRRRRSVGTIGKNRTSHLQLELLERGDHGLCPAHVKVLDVGRDGLVKVSLRGQGLWRGHVFSYSEIQVWKMNVFSKRVKKMRSLTARLLSFIHYFSFSFVSAFLLSR